MEPTYSQKVKEAQEVAAKACTQWECDFLDSMDEWEGDFTEKQKAIIDRIYNKVCESSY
jgi:hypothetical protein